MVAASVQKGVVRVDGCNARWYRGNLTLPSPGGSGSYNAIRAIRQSAFFLMSLVRSKAVSRLRLATAIHDIAGLPCHESQPGWSGL